MLYPAFTKQKENFVNLLLQIAYNLKKSYMRGNDRPVSPTRV